MHKLSSLAINYTKSIIRKHSISQIPSLTCFQRNNSNTSWDESKLPLPAPFLREMSHSNYDSKTHQRNTILFHKENGKIMYRIDDHDDYYRYTAIRSWVEDDEKFVVQWKDGFISRYPLAWMKRMIRDTYSKEEQEKILSHLSHMKENTKKKSKQQGEEEKQKCKFLYPYNPIKRILWKDLTEKDLRNDLSLPFQSVVGSSNQDGVKHAIQLLYQYGILFVSDTPTDDSGVGIASFASAISGGAKKGGTDGPMRTLYGTIWSTSSSGMVDGTSVADSAYGQGALPLHTDMNYLRNPPGLQMFCMVNPATYGGASVYLDGFAAAKYLQQTDNKAFQTLSQTPRRYRCIDTETGWHLEAHGPIISTSPFTKDTILSIRHNDLDRMPDLFLDEEIYEKLMHSHWKWDEVLGMDEFHLVVDLKPGEMVITANQRVLHGRHSFATNHDCPREIMGCYVSQDELDSRFRWEGYILD